MNKERIYLSLAHLGGQEIDFITNAFETNWITSGGPNVVGFENDLQDYLENDAHVAALNSGTAALHLGLLLLGVKSGDEVICQSMTFVASANSILYVGATPVFIDSEPKTGNMCPVALEEAIIDRISKGKKPKVIITVHLYGMPYMVDEIHAIALKYDIFVLEDSAEALGSLYKNKKCGTFGEMAIISFNGNKIITTSSGGVLITKTKKLKEKAIFLATQAREDVVYYQHKEVGYNYRMSNICAGIGRGQMQILAEHIHLKRELHEFYANYFEGINGVTVFSEPNEDFYSNYWLSTILLDPNIFIKKTAENLRLAMEKENIECRPFWKPMHLQPAFENYSYYGKDIAANLFHYGLCLPSGVNLNEDQKRRIKSVLISFFL